MRHSSSVSNRFGPSHPSVNVQLSVSKSKYQLGSNAAQSRSIPDLLDANLEQEDGDGCVPMKDAGEAFTVSKADTATSRVREWARETRGVMSSTVSWRLLLLGVPTGNVRERICFRLHLFRPNLKKIKFILKNIKFKLKKIKSNLKKIKRELKKIKCKLKKIKLILKWV